jgi:two-component system, OmpR family, alkaline phosphatase synthesis response regulator PhoP
MSFTILLVEDDQSLAEITRFNLEMLGYQVTHIDDGAIALECIHTQSFDLMIFDVMLPNVSGLELCRKARDLRGDQNILILTALESETDRVVGLEMGADDYMAKPFSVRELQARVKAQLRRVQHKNEHVTDNQKNTETNVPNLNEANKDQPLAALNFDGLSIDHQAHQVRVNSLVVELTLKEFELLNHLAKQPGRVFSREQLLTDIWGYNFGGYEHTVNTHVNRLRKKLSPLNYVQTVWGVGYKFQVTQG